MLYIKDRKLQKGKERNVLEEKLEPKVEQTCKASEEKESYPKQMGLP